MTVATRGFHRDAEAKPEEKTGHHCAPHIHRAAEQHRNAQQPKRRPQVVRSKFERNKVITRGNPGQENRPYAHAPRKKQRADAVSAPHRHEVHRQQDESHPVKNGRPIADQTEDRREHDLEKRHVIVENIPVLHEAAGPGPDHVQVLRFVAVEPITHHVQHLECDHEREQARRRDEFSPRHAEMICAARDP